MTQSLPQSLRRYAAEGQPGRDWFFPLNGWLLTALVRLEEDWPGTLMTAVKAGALWRNAVAIAVATGALDRPETFILRAYGEIDDGHNATSLRAQFAQAIATMKPKRNR